jgi:hypothetical protein
MDRICIRPYCNDAATVISGTIHLCGCPGDFGAYCVEHVPYAVCDCVLCGAELACWRIGVVPVALEQWGPDSAVTCRHRGTTQPGFGIGLSRCHEAAQLPVRCAATVAGDERSLRRDRLAEVGSVLTAKSVRRLIPRDRTLGHVHGVYLVLRGLTAFDPVEELRA